MDAGVIVRTGWSGSQLGGSAEETRSVEQEEARAGFIINDNGPSKSAVNLRERAPISAAPLNMSQPNEGVGAGPRTAVNTRRTGKGVTGWRKPRLNVELKKKKKPLGLNPVVFDSTFVD